MACNIKQMPQYGAYGANQGIPNLIPKVGLAAAPLALTQVKPGTQVHCINGSCGSLLWTDVLVATILAILLFPGFIFSIPPVPASDTKVSLGKRMFFTREVTIPDVIVHGLLFFGLFALYKWMSLKRQKVCK